MLASLKIKFLYHYFNFRINKIDDPHRIRFRKLPYKTLFLLSHMRSGSSLLTHILNGNSEIIGYGETHLNYQTETDLKALQFKVYWQLKDVNMSHKYILDKILHDHKILNKNILKNPRLFTIFLMREPTRTLPSILYIKPHWSEEKALVYYCQRLKTLVDYAKIINNPKRCLLITHNQLLQNTESVFTSLQQFLQTTDKFFEEYQVLKTTGMRGIGDSSDNIKAGRIVKTNRRLDITISPALINQGMKVFVESKKQLEHFCTTVTKNT